MNEKAPLTFAGQLSSTAEQSAVSKQPSFKISMTKKQGNAEPLTVVDGVGELPSITVAPVHATITVSGGRTINMGNFNSAKIEVSLSLPVDPSDLEAGWDFCYNWVDKKLASALEDDDTKKEL